MEKVAEGEHEAFVSCLTLYELYRLALKGKLDKDKIDTIVDAISSATTVVWICDVERCRHAATLSHGMGIPSVDALILSSLLEEGVQEIYTTDHHFASYNAKAVKIKII